MKILKTSILIVLITLLHGILLAQDKKPVVDEVVAIVGNKAILMSDVENQYLQYRLQNQTEDPNIDMRCMILDNILLSKLLITQAQLDSVDITDAQVEERIERNMRYFISQFGSKQKLEEYYKKPMSEIKEDLRANVRDQLYVEFMQDKITRSITITPTEIKAYFKKIPTDSLPQFPAEYEMIEISKIPKVSQVEIDAVKEKLTGFRNRIVGGDDFATLAVMYSEDPGSALKGGELGFVNRGELYPEFETAAFSLKAGEVSPIIKTRAGYHIIQLIERRGQSINVRHLLLTVKPGSEEMRNSKLSLDSAYAMLKDGTLTVEDAVAKYSESGTKKSGGLLINQYSGGVVFSENQIDESIAPAIEKLAVGGFTNPILSKTDDGETCYRIVVLKKKTPPHQANMVNDYDKIQKAALEDKKQRILDNWVSDKIKDIYVNIYSTYKKCTFTHSWVK